MSSPLGASTTIPTLKAGCTLAYGATLNLGQYALEYVTSGGVYGTAASLAQVPSGATVLRRVVI